MVVLLSVQAGSDPFAPLSLTPSWEQFNAIFSDAYHLTIIAQTSLLALGVAWPRPCWVIRWRCG